MTVTRSFDVLKPGCLSGSRIAVTGAGSGIGRSIALRLAGLGATVGGIGRRADALEETRNLAAASACTGKVIPMLCDIRDYDAAAETLDGFAADGLDGLVNNAGGQFYAAAADISTRGFAAVLDLNLTALFTLCRTARPYLAQRGGAIVNISIVGAERGGLGHAHAISARSGAAGLTKALALEWGPEHVRVNALAVGTTATDAFCAATTPSARARLAAQTPIPRLVETAEIAEMVAFLLSGAGEMLTGQTLRIDGGAFLAAPIDMQSVAKESSA